MKDNKTDYEWCSAPGDYLRFCQLSFLNMLPEQPARSSAQYID